MGCSLPGRQGEGAWHVWNIRCMPDLVLGISQRWFPCILSNEPMPIFMGETAFCSTVVLPGRWAKSVPPGRTAEASIPRLCEAQAHILPSLLFPARLCPLQIYTPTPAQMSEPSVGMLPPCLAHPAFLPSLFMKGFCFHLEYVIMFCPSSVVTSEPALFYCCIPAQNKWLRYF